ncbi:hypothetical protein Tco_1552057 [Tanacetum coccineum]
MLPFRCYLILWVLQRQQGSVFLVVSFQDSKILPNQVLCKVSLRSQVRASKGVEGLLVACTTPGIFDKVIQVSKSSCRVVWWLGSQVYGLAYKVDKGVTHGILCLVRCCKDEGFAGTAGISYNI